MRRICVLAGVAIVALVPTTAAASAPTPTVKEKYVHRYEMVKKRFGTRTPGRHIVRDGVRYKWVSGDGKKSHWFVRPATNKQVAKSARQLKAFLTPPPRLLVRTASPPSQAPAGTATASVRAPSGGTLSAIAQCESGGNPSTNTGNGFYGKYQFTQSTWQSVGGSGNPAAASEGEQDSRAAALYAREGSSPWPVCGR